jgi:hypothetical protein
MSSEDVWMDAFYNEKEDEDVLQSLMDYDELTHPRKFLTWKEICDGVTWESKYGKDIP